MTIEKIKCDKCEKEISDPWITISCRVARDSHLCEECARHFSKWLREPVEEEYPLTFEQALKEMLNGEFVQSEYEINTLFRFNSGQSCFEDLTHPSYRWDSISTIWENLQKGKWRVVG